MLRKQKVDEVQRRNPDMPEYMKRAYRAWQETGDILKGNDTLSRAWKRQLAAKASSKRDSSRKRESSRGRTYREDRNGGPSQGMKDDYLEARKRAIEANRPDLVEELDRSAVKNGFFD